MTSANPWHILACANLGARAAMRLLEAFQQPEIALSASPKTWVEKARLSQAQCGRLSEAINSDHTDELARLSRLGIKVVGFFDNNYPKHLRTIVDPPIALYLKGNLPSNEQPAIAIVGSRHASPYGRHTAAELATALAQRGFAVISGMALGADASAHEGCLRVGGCTVAVLGCGIDVIYPPEHRELYERIAGSGAVVTEFPPGYPPIGANFPIRNRIISGLSLGVVVVEAPEKSGALNTASHALEQGREVFAVPGSVHSGQSRGTHNLIRDGAKLVERVEDILEELQLQITVPVIRYINPLSGPDWGGEQENTENLIINQSFTPSRKPMIESIATTLVDKPITISVPALPPEEDVVFKLLTMEAKHVDALIESSNMTPSQVNAALLMLELKGYVQRRPGNQYVRLR